MKNELQNRKAFKIYRSYYEVAKELPEELRGEFLMAILEMQFEGKEPKLQGMVKFAFISQKHSLDKQLQGYKDGLKGGAPPKGNNNHTPEGNSNPPLKGTSNQEQEQEKEQVTSNSNSKPEQDSGRGFIVLKSTGKKVKWAECVSGYLSMLNTVRNKYRKHSRSLTILSDKGQRQLKARLTRDGYTKEDFTHCFEVAFNEEHHIDTDYKYLTAEFFTRQDKLEAFLSREIKKPEQKSRPINNQPVGG